MERASTRPAETTMWQGRPSALLNFPLDLLLALGAIVATVALLALGAASPEAAPAVPWLIFAAWVLAAGISLVGHIRRRSTRYLLTNERLRITTGLFSTRTEEIELRRVRDSAVYRPFWLRLLGLGNVELFSADLSMPQVTLRAVPRPDDLQSTIRAQVQEMTARYGVREIDVI
jgi:uncharacterized membrane protein YdbT with pleckstrin-like domain